MAHTSPATIALSLETAKNAALMLGGGFVTMSIISAIVVKKIVTKLVLVVVLVALAIAMWSQRANLQDCAEKAKDRVSGTTATVECQFFGLDVSID
ncbi:MAG: hypothetical protein ACO3C1_05140 [Ilumatobacteraceae bacterium]